MLQRIKLLENNVNELAEFKTRFSKVDIKRDKTAEWALRYGLLESIQIVIDIACHLVSKNSLGNPDNYAECVELLHEHEYINEGLAQKLAAMIGLRNILVHEYIQVEAEKLYNLLENIGDFKEFAISIKDAV